MKQLEFWKSLLEREEETNKRLEDLHKEVEEIEDLLCSREDSENSIAIAEAIQSLNTEVRLLREVLSEGFGLWAAR